jgi:hypothetical protein
METGTILFMTEGWATAMPETALVTETAGVRIPSAIVRDVAKRHCSQFSKLIRHECSTDSGAYEDQKRPAQVVLEGSARWRRASFFVEAHTREGSVFVVIDLPRWKDTLI